ncbi:MAG: O-antigen ligase family protein [Gemmatimonadales bacterium]
MISLAYAALWLFIFSLPWESIIRVPGVAIVSRATGGLALAIALFAVASTARVRRWHPLHVAAFLFVISAACGLFMLSSDRLPAKFWTFVQLFLVLFMIWELATSWRRVVGLFGAYVLGAWVSSVATVLLYRRQGEQLRRFAAGGADANDLAMTLVLALPMAWYLSIVARQRFLRWACRGYLLIGLVSILLTGSRGGMLASIVALTIVPLSMTKLSPRKLATALTILLIGGGLAAAYVPEKIVNRLATTQSEVEDLRLGGRFKLWVAGIRAFVYKPMMGYGSGGFVRAITPQLGSESLVAHNSYLSVLVEEGVVGLTLYLAMLLATFRAVLTLPQLERRFALVLLATLATAMLPLTWEDRKPVWFILAALVGLSRAQSAGGILEKAALRTSQRAPGRVGPGAVPRLDARSGPRPSADRSPSA